MKASISTSQHSSNSPSEPFSDRASQPSLNLLISIGQALEKLLTLLSGSTEIKISRTLNSDGQTVWYVYDPSTNSNLALGSEAEVRIWLEQRYK